MSVKYRVLDYNGTFYPQERKWLGWFDMKSDCYWEYTVNFASMQKAVDFIKSRTAKSKVPIVVWQSE